LRTSRQVFLSQARLAAAVPPRPLAHWRRTRRQVRLPDGPGEARRKRFAEHPQAKHDSEGREPLPCDKLAPCAPSGTREIVGAPSSTWHVASNRVLALGRTQRAPESGGSEPSESKEATRPPWDNPPMALELRRWVPR